MQSAQGFKPFFMATGIGSMPYASFEEACPLILASTQEAPFWPQLPKRSFRENMYAQFSEGFPGIRVDEANKKIVVQSSGSFLEELEECYKKIWRGEVNAFGISESNAQGLHGFLRLLKNGSLDHARVLKGQVTGPISFGLTLTDENHRSILYNDDLEEVIVKILAFKARWQEDRFMEHAAESRSLIFFDEPYMASFGSSFFNLSKQRVTELLDICTEGLKGLKGVHCCGNTDWSLLLSARFDVLSLDAYDYGKTLILYPEKVRSFLDEGGTIAWGIVPTDERVLKESAGSLIERLEDLIQELVEKGVPEEKIVEQSMVTPSCGTGTLSVELTEEVFSRLKEVSEVLRKRYGLSGAIGS